MPRQSLFRRLVSLLLAALVLTTSVGLTVQRQTCRMSGRSTTGIAMPGRVAPIGCNDWLAPATPSAQDDCCDFSSHLHKLSAPAHELAAGIMLPSPPPAVWLPGAAGPAVVPTVARSVAGPQWFAADSSPPPRSGRGLLAFIGVLVV